MPDDVTLNEAVATAEADLQALLAEQGAQTDAVAEAQSALDRIIDRVQDQTIFVNMLRTAAQRYGSRGVPEENATGETQRWQSLPRTDAIMLALRHIGKPVGPTTISQFLRQRGRTNDSTGAVSATLGHLATTGRVTSLGHGQWVPGDSAIFNALPEDLAFMAGGSHPEHVEEVRDIPDT